MEESSTPTQQLITPQIPGGPPSLPACLRMCYTHAALLAHERAGLGLRAA